MTPKVRPSLRHALRTWLGILAACGVAAPPAIASSPDLAAISLDERKHVAAESNNTDDSLELAPSSARIAGTDPRVYLRARKPVPSAVRDLKALPISVSLQILREGPGPFLVDQSLYPSQLAAVEIEALRDLERRALLVGALTVVTHGTSNVDPVVARAAVAPLFWSTDVEVRAEAVERLGVLRTDAVDVLVAAAKNDADARVRAAACVGLGHQRSTNAVAALRPFVNDTSDPARQVAAIRALGLAGSRWAWQARGNSQEGTRVRALAGDVLAQAVTGRWSLAARSALRDARARLQLPGNP